MNNFNKRIDIKLIFPQIWSNITSIFLNYLETGKIYDILTKR